MLGILSSRSALRRLLPALGLLGSTVLAACSEKLDSSAACPLLCPEQSVNVRDTVIDAVMLDTTLVGFPPQGPAAFHLLALRTDTLDTRVVIRFDTLGKQFVPAGKTVPEDITAIDSVFLKLRLDRLGAKGTGPVVIDAFDVDTASASDTVNAVVTSFFRPDRLLGSATIADPAAADSLRIQLSKTAVLARITSGTHLRVGLRVRGPGSGQIRVLGTLAATTDLTPRLTFDPSTDTAYAPITINPVSLTPSGNSLATNFTDYTIVVQGAGAPVGNALAVGAIPGRRSYLRFSLPSRIVDSTTVVRAELVLTQQPVRFGLDLRDTVTVAPDVVVANSVVTDLTRAALITAPGSGYSLDSLRVIPNDSGPRTLNLVHLVRSWRGLAVDRPRAIVLRTRAEGATPGVVSFFSTEALPSLRPRLRVSYIPSVGVGLP